MGQNHLIRTGGPLCLGVRADDGHRRQQRDEHDVEHNADDEVGQVELELVPEVRAALAHLRHRCAARVDAHLAQHLIRRQHGHLFHHFHALAVWGPHTCMRCWSAE